MRNSRLAALAAAGAGLTLVLGLAACDSDDEPELVVGFEDCLEDPNTCNSGDRDAGGTVRVWVDSAPGAYLGWSPEGGSVYTLQSTHGILPYFGQFQPDGEYEFNFNVLAQEPELIEDGPNLQSVWTIREDAVWSNGEPIQANDLVILWKMSDPDQCAACRPRSAETDIEEVTGSPDGKTVTVTYKEGLNDPEWFAYGSAHNIIGGLPPSSKADELGLDIENPDDLATLFEWFNDNPLDVSGGPLRIESWELEESVIKVPNENWYVTDEDQVATLERVVIRFIQDTSVVPQAVTNDELDMGFPFGWDNDAILALRDVEGIRMLLQSGPSWEHLDVNFDNPQLQDLPLRQAIFTAVNREEIAQRNYGQVFPDIELRNNHLHGQSGEFYVDHMAEFPDYGTGNVEAARDILAQAGYEGADGGPGSLTLDGETIGPLRLRSTSTPARNIAMEIAQANLAEIGIEIQIDTTDDLGGTLGSGDYDLMEFGWSGTPLFSAQTRQFWGTDSGSNFGGFSNERLDELADLVDQSTTLEEIAGYADEAMPIVLEEAYVLPYYSTPVYAFVTEGWINVRDNVQGSLRGFYNVNQWGVAAQ